ncbi:MAG: PAS domain S-box protein [Syntrophomonadaceae bacterium]
MKANQPNNEYSYLITNDKIGVLRCRLGDGLLLSASEGLLTMFGYKRTDKVVGVVSTLVHYVNANERERMLASSVDNVIAGYDLPMKKVNGTDIWVSVSARIYPELGYYEGVVVDITAQRSVEQDLREAETAHGRLFENTHAIMMLIDPDTGDIVEANPAAAVFYGYPREILTKMNLDAISTLPREEMLNRLSQADELGTVSNYRHRLASGEIRDIESRRGLVTINGRQLVYVTNNDISERIITEANREKELLKFRVLYDLALAMIDENSLEANLKLVADKTRELLGTDLAFLALRDEEKQDVHIHTLSGHLSPEIENLRLPWGIGHGGLVAQLNRGMIIDDYASSRRISHEKDNVAMAEGMVSGMAVPLQMGKKNLGVLYAYNRHKTEFSPQDLETLTLIGNLAAVEVSRKMSDAALTASQQQMTDIIDFWWRKPLPPG